MCLYGSLAASLTTTPDAAKYYLSQRGNYRRAGRSKARPGEKAMILTADQIESLGGDGTMRPRSEPDWARSREDPKASLTRTRVRPET
jgi:hypothetical protein